jgi:hypothetical protein
MQDTKSSKKPDPKREPLEGQHQTDLAEGELDTVEESIRKHEEKGDLAAPDTKKKPKVRKAG